MIVLSALQVDKQLTVDDNDMKYFCSNSIFFMFSLIFFHHDYIIYINVSHMQLQTSQVMTSQIRSHTEYLTQIYNTLVLILYLKLIKNVASLAVLMRFYDDL